MNIKPLLLISALFSFCVILSCNEDDDTGTSTAKPIKISANDLMRKFTKNSKKYDTSYAQKALQIDGKIAEIESASLGNAIFVLNTDNKDGAKIKCEMLNDDMQYQPGDVVSIKGFFKEHHFHITMDKCVTVGD